MNKALIVLASAVLTTGLLSACVKQSSVDTTDVVSRAVTADDLLVVDCLLPGQVRQLGSRLTYMTARRPIQTTVHDCQVRGGEYVAYDRATYASALAIWMPLAEEGDPDAQNKVGEIYERGIAGTPDPVLAAAWYRKAAEQGHARAQINLGFLYEKGLGVDKDPEAALSWYRKASQLPDAVLIDRQSMDAQQARIDSLKSDLDRSRAELDRAREALRRSEQRLRQQREDLHESLPQDPTGLSEIDRQQLADNRARLEKQRIELAERQKRIGELESQTRRQQENLLLLKTEGKSQREQLQLVRTELKRTQDDLAHYQDLAAQNERQLAQTRADLAAVSTNRENAAYQRIEQLATQLNEREQALGTQERKVAQLQEKITQLSSQLELAQSGRRADLEQLQAALSRAESELAEARTTAAQRTDALEQVRSELEDQKTQAGAAGERLAELQIQLEGREQVLAGQQKMVQRLRKESDQLRQKLEQLEEQQADGDSLVAENAAPTSPPSIQLIDPPLVSVRSAADNRIPVKRGLQHRTVIGQVMAPAGLYALNINGVRTQHDATGLFETDIMLASEETPVSVVAIDRQGRRTTLAFSLVSQGDGDSMVAKRINPLQGVDVGEYHALVIGNQEYETLPDLDTSVNDAEAMADMLRTKFGYKVTLLLDANRYEILSALNRLRKELTDKDNLLVYYAGHGELDRVNLRGHWLPVDAEAQNTANWISNVAITDILNAMAVRHVLLIADSCYSGALTRSALSQTESGQSDEARSHWLKTLSKMRSRTALTSGGLAPVLDGGGGNHSVFAKSLLTVLRELNDITEGQRVFREVSARVSFEATRYQVEQVPEYAPIKYAGHEAGDFLFIPKTYL
jgi:TPR repeat protein/uncharacterized caspase-like protein